MAASMYCVFLQVVASDFPVQQLLRLHGCNNASTQACGHCEMHVNARFAGLWGLSQTALQQGRRQIHRSMTARPHGSGAGQTLGVYHFTLTTVLCIFRKHLEVIG